MEKIKNKISAAAEKYYRLVFFILIFALFCYIFNQNSQTLNYYLKRGTILEYSIDKTQKIDEEKIDTALLDFNIRYSYINVFDLERPLYDKDGNQISKKLIINLPYVAKKDKEQLFNGVSDFVFKNYPTSKLVNVKVLGHLYFDRFSSVINFTVLLLITFCIWAVILNMFSKKNFFEEIKNYIINFLKKQKESLKNLFSNTKKKGAGYFLRQVLLDNNDEEKEDSLTKEIISTIVFVIVAVVFIRYFIGELRWIPTESMYPTIKKLDRVYVEKLKYPTKTIERGDILVFYPPDVKLSSSPLAVFSRLTGIFCKDVAFIKRAIGLPGDKFEVKYLKDIDEYRVYINDDALNEPYINSIFNAGYEYPPKGYDGAWTPCSHPEVKYCGPFVIPEHKYFMMGDNRGNSADSRFWGFLDENRIIGRANFMFWPLGRINLMRDKYIILDKEIKNNQKVQDKFIVDRYSY